MVEPELLRTIELFADFNNELLERMANLCDTLEFQRGDVLFAEGDESDQLYVTMSGRIAMVNRSIDGRESVVALMEDGDLFGEMPLFDGGV